MPGTGRGGASSVRLPLKPNQTTPQLHCTHVDLHLAVEAVAEHEVVRQLQAVWLHGVAGAIVVVAHVAWGMDDRRVWAGGGVREWWFGLWCRNEPGKAERAPDRLAPSIVKRRRTVVEVAHARLGHGAWLLPTGCRGSLLLLLPALPLGRRCLCAAAPRLSPCLRPCGPPNAPVAGSIGRCHGVDESGGGVHGGREPTKTHTHDGGHGFGSTASASERASPSVFAAMTMVRCECDVCNALACLDGSHSKRGGRAVNRSIWSMNRITGAQLNPCPPAIQHDATLVG